MKYEIRFHKTEVRTVQVFAENHEAAYKLAQEQNEDFTPSDVITELLDEDEPGRDFVLQCVCEGCGKHIWDEEEYRCDIEGVTLCPECYAACPVADPEEAK